MPDTILAAHKVSVMYGAGEAAALALDQVSLELEPGKVTLLMGASGSGKTTLLSILGCLRRPDRGHVTLLDRDLSGAGDRELTLLRRDHIGFVFQFFRLFRSLNALENVSMGLELSGKPASDRRAAEQALETVGLGAKRHLLPGQMSGGERQRVAIARALIKSPGILLADEPTAALDGASGRQVAELIRACVQERRMVAVVATHDPRLVPFADRIIEVRDGGLYEERSTS